MKQNNKRKIVSILLLISLIAMPITGGITHATHEQMSGHIWLHIHIFSGFIFTVSAIFHLIWNWKTMKRYITGK